MAKLSLTFTPVSNYVPTMYSYYSAFSKRVRAFFTPVQTKSNNFPFAYFLPALFAGNQAYPTKRTHLAL